MTLSHMADTQQDFTLFFHKLTQLAHGEDLADFFDADWLKKWNSLGVADATHMQVHNPVLIPRNHQVERAIQHAYDGNFETFKLLHEAWKKPFDKNLDFAELEIPPTESERVRETFCGT